MSQRAIAGAVAKTKTEEDVTIFLGKVGSPRERTTRILMVEIFGQRNIPHLPPHIQWKRLMDAITPPPSPQKKAAPNARERSAKTRHQAKPCGCGKHNSRVARPY